MPIEKERFVAKNNYAGGPGWLVVDGTTGKDVAWVYDQARNPELDENRAKAFAALLNKSKSK